MATQTSGDASADHPHQTLLDLLRHGKHEDALARAAMPNEVNQVHDGSTPLLVATTRGWEDVVVALVKNGAKVNFTSELGETPLMRAIKCGKIGIDTIRLMLEYGGKETINAATKDDAFFPKWTALHFACDRDMNQNVVVPALLVAYGADVDALAGNGKTPKDMCQGREEFLKALSRPNEVLKSHHYSMRDSLDSGHSEEMQIGNDHGAGSDEHRKSSLLNFAHNLFSKKASLEKKGSLLINQNHS